MWGQQMPSLIAALLVLFAVLMINIGCTSTIDKAENQSKPELLTQCTEPRPEICTMEYDPVCATHEDGSSKTYSTGCTACSHKEVMGYNSGECK